MQRKKLVFLPIAIIAVSLLGAVILVVSKPDVKPAPSEALKPYIRAIEVMPRSYRAVVKSQGNVKPRTESSLVTQVAGRVQKVSRSFVPGGFFEAGDVLVVLDARDYELAVVQAEAQVKQASLRLNLQEEEARVARAEWQRLGKGDPPALAARTPQVEEARAALSAAKAALSQARLNLQRTRITAPFAGRVRAKSADVGQFVLPGTPLGLVFAVDYAEVRLPLPDSELAFLDMPLDFRGASRTERGPAVALSAPFAGRMHTWEGYITRLESEIDPASRMMHAVARVENPYARKREDGPPLSVGMFVQAKIQGREMADVTVLPRSALRGQHEVLVVDAENRLRFRTVDIARTEADSVIINSGIAAGELVCVSPLDAVVDGMAVRLLDESGRAQQQAISQEVGR